MNSSQNTDFTNDNTVDNFNFQKEFFKYLIYWKYFLISTVFFLSAAFTYLRYSSKVYETRAKIQIIDKKETSLELLSASDLFSKSKINLENEIEIIKSYPIIEGVIKNLNLQISIFAIGDVMQALAVKYPFGITLNTSVDSLTNKTYRINKAEKGFEIIDLQNKSKSYYFKGTTSSNYNHDLPFEILNFNNKKFVDYANKGYEIRFLSENILVEDLKNSLKISQVGKESDIIELSFNSTKKEYSENFLNELVDVFNDDGIKDRQLIHKRTIDFVNARYSHLSVELDSIEIAKQLYKVDNNLVNLSANSTISLEKSLKSEEGILSIENQISITNLLLNTLANDKLELLPANMLIQNNEINLLISKYNQFILDRKKLILSAGFNNPSAKQLDNTLSDFRSNIIYSLQNNLSQLKNIKSKLSNQFYKYNCIYKID